MDPVSFAASVLTLTTVLSSSAKVVCGLVKQPIELQALADRLSHLASVVDSVIETADLQGFKPHDLEPLYSIRSRICNVQTTFNTRIRAVKHTKPTPKIRRTTWLRRSTEIEKIEKEIATIKEDLNAVINTLLLSSIGVILHEIRQNHNHFSGASLPSSLLIGQPGHSYPEIYIVEQPRRQQLLISSMHEVERTAEFRVAKYYVLCPIDARHWRQVIVTATRPATQHQSQVSASLQVNCAYKMLPGSIQPRLQVLLETQRIELYDSVIQVHIDLELDNLNNVTFDPEHCTLQQDPTETLAVDTSQYIDEIRHRGLPQYCESDVLTITRESEFFFVLIGPRVNVECKLPFTERTMTDHDPVENFVTGMNLMLAAQGCVGIPRFSGFVVDDSHTRLQSYLLEAPCQGRMWTLMATAKEAGQPISWRRRDRWIRQLIQITSDVHKRGLTIGYHALDFYKFFIDSKDDIKLMQLCSRRAGIANKLGFLAPELRRFTKPRAVAESYASSVKTDMFNLGLILWQLVHYVKIGNHTLCRMNGCTTFPRYRCTADHTNPTSLPFDNNSGVPTYAQTIIDHCRQDKPSKRLSAAALLSLLPPPIQHSTEHSGVLLSSTTTPPWQDTEKPAMSPTCDECGNTASFEHYHCNVCNQGDFDLCPSCYASDIRCYESNHVMVRRINGPNGLVNAQLSSKTLDH